MMTRMIKLNAFLITLLFVFPLFSQRLDLVYDDAEKVFYQEDFRAALEFYEIILGIDADYEDVQYKAEICSLLTDYRNMPLDKFLGFEKQMSRKDKFYYYWKGRIYKDQYLFDEALLAFRTFLRTKTYKSDEIKEEARKWMSWSSNALMYFNNPGFFEIHLLDEGINTIKAELSPIFFEDSNELLFISNRDEGDPNRYTIHHSYKKGEKWNAPTELPELGTFERGNANIEVVDEDGKLFQFRLDKGGDLFFSEPLENGWSRPEEFDSRISSTHLSSHFFINEHEDRIIFASDVGSRKEPNLDLLQSYKNPETGKWSKPELFATTINTMYNEDSPYLSPDEKTLYFASDGHGSMGGYDIFKTTFDEATQTWSEPENMGFPINSPDDELHFKMNPDQKSGYFTSNRLHTIGDFDVFFFWEIHKVKMEGRIVDTNTNTPVKGGKIYFRPYTYLDMYFYSEIDENGKYSANINSEDVFQVQIVQDGEMIHKEDFEIHATNGLETTHIKNFYLGDGEAQADHTDHFVVSEEALPTLIDEAESKVERLGSKFRHSNRAVAQNVYFDFGTSTLKPESTPVLRSILNLLISKPGIVIEISGHTDNVGEHDTNMLLSKRRAEAVRSWLVEHGIAPARMIARGYGETKPIASNDDEKDGRELNRRIEIALQE